MKTHQFVLQSMVFPKFFCCIYVCMYLPTCIWAVMLVMAMVVVMFFCVLTLAVEVINA